jgi:hypothetical protein
VERVNAVVFWWLSPLLVAGANPAASETAAAPPAAIAVEVTGECPTREAVLAALLPVLGDQPGRALREPPRVIDSGGRFEVTALGHSQEYVDSARNCAERARVAAVFIALTLNPPTFEMPPPPPPPPVIEKPAPPPPPPPEPAPPAGWARVGVAARIDNAASSAPGPSDGVTLGGELRVAGGGRHLGVVATGGMLAPTEQRVSSVTVRQQRFPLSLAAGVRLQPARSFELTAALGLALTPFTLRGQGLATSSPATRLDAGVRAGIDLHFPNLAGRVTPFVGVHAEYALRSYKIEVDPLGEIGSTGQLWIGASAGVAFEVRKVAY